MKRFLALTLTLATVLSLFAGCTQQPAGTTGTNGGTAGSTPAASTPVPTPPPTTAPADPWADYEIKTLAEAIAICQQTGSTETTEKYYIRGTITEVANEKYGNMTITDGTDSLFIYGTYSADGSTRYDSMTDAPVAGDEVLLYGTLMNYNNTKPEMMNAWIIDVIPGQGVEKPPMPDADSTLTIAQLLAMPLSSGEVTDGRYYVTANVKSVTNAAYGAMIIEDETGSISIYGSQSADGSQGYADMANKPVKGDKVKLYCQVQNFNGTMEIKSAWIIEVIAGESSYVPSDYADMTIADARAAAKGTKLRLTGVVARITYADGVIPCGFILVDGTDSLYIYGKDAAALVTEGDTVTVAGSKTWWIQEKEVSNAEKFGYLGCNQLEDVYLVENDGGKSDFDTSWIQESSVQAMLNTPFDADVTGRIFKVTAIVRRNESGGVVNYYINDLDGTTGSYSYSQCGCAEFDQWLRQFDGKVCTLYLAVQNAKSNPSGCLWRFVPISATVREEAFTAEEIAAAAVRLYGLPQFLGQYTGDPALELVTKVDGLVGFDGIQLSYSSSDSKVAYFENDVFHCGAAGNATITVKATVDGKTAEATVTVTVKEQVSVDYVDVNTAINTAVGETVSIKGIVGPSVVAPNKTGFYLIDETGVIVVLSDSETMATLQIGQEIVIQGKRDRLHNNNGDHAGQTCISGAKVLANYYGDHDYPTNSFDGELSVKDFYELDYTKDFTTSVYLVKGYVVLEEAAKYTNIYISNVPTFDKSNPDHIYVRLYCSSASQYNWLKAYAGQEVTVEMAPTNYNNKKYYTGCVIAVVLDDGTKVLNTLNFN